MPSLRQVQRVADPPPIETIECEDCGEDCSPNELDNGVCEPCIDEFYYDCYSCGERMHNESDDLYYVGDCTYCSDCYHDRYVYCEGCDEDVDRDEVSYNESRGLYQCDNCYDEHYDDCVENFEDNLSLPRSTTTSKNFDKLNIHRHVGIEAECLYPHETHSMSYPVGWQSVSDGSIEADDNYYGTELVSTPANGNALDKTIDYLTNWSNEYGGAVNRSCGLHLHFNSLDLSARQVAHIAIVYTKIEDTIFSMMPPSRRGSNWCRKLGLGLVDLQSVKYEQDLVDLYYRRASPSTEKYNDNRYYGLNIHSRYYHGSLEFRHHSGTLNGTKIRNWIRICNAIIERGIRLADNLDGLITYINTMSNEDRLSYLFSTDLVEYINKRIAKFDN